MENTLEVLAPRRRMRPLDTSDIEDGGVQDKCFACGHKQKKYVCINDDGIKTKNFTGVCVNPKCFRFEDVSKVHSWELVA